MVITVVLSGCATAFLPQPYRQQISQGREIDEARFRALAPGMQYSTVVEQLGQPLLGHSFHPQRLDYIYYESPAGARDQHPQRVSLLFESGLLREIRFFPVAEEISQGFQ